MTKKEESMLIAWLSADVYDDLWDAYKRPSENKVKAWRRIKTEMLYVNGYGLRVTGHNSSFFSCAYAYDDENGKTHIVYHTYAHKYDFIC